MDIDNYLKFLKKQNISNDISEECITIIKDFTKYLEDIELNKTVFASDKEKVIKFANILIDEGRNTIENFTFLRDYTSWLNQRDLYVAFIEIMDCYNALEVLSEKIKDKSGKKTHAFIFQDDFPPLGADEKTRCLYTSKIMKRMEQKIIPNEIGNIWFQVQHGISPNIWVKSDMADKAKYRQCKDIDEFLEQKRIERDIMLTKLYEENELWYTIEIDSDVLDFIKGNPEMEVGKREGNKIYITKVPYNVKRYLNEKDIQMKRYFACHCPLVREAILNNNEVSPEVCNCSLGHASHYLAGLDQDIKGEVLESVVKGDARCRFVFYLPD